MGETEKRAGGISGSMKQRERCQTFGGRLSFRHNLQKLTQGARCLDGGICYGRKREVNLKKEGE